MGPLSPLTWQALEGPTGYDLFNDYAQRLQAVSLSPAIIDAMVEAGASVEVLAAAMKADLAERDDRENVVTSVSAKRTREYRKRRNLSDNEWAALTRMVIERDGFTCSYCGCETDTEENGYAIDHVFPLNRGGNNDLDNLAMSCRSCNSSKGDKILDEEWYPPNDDFIRWTRGEPN